MVALCSERHALDRTSVYTSFVYASLPAGTRSYTLDTKRTERTKNRNQLRFRIAPSPLPRSQDEAKVVYAFLAFRYFHVSRRLRHGLYVSAAPSVRSLPKDPFS